MTVYARIHAQSTAHRPTALRLLLASAAAAVVCLLAAPSAGAVVEEVGGTQVGLMPRSGLQLSLGEGGSFTNPQGRPVLHATNVFVIYWDPTDAYHPEWERLIDTFVHNLGNVSGQNSAVLDVDTQYTDSSNEGAGSQTVFRGAYTDTQAYPSSGRCTDPQAPPHAIACITDAQIRSQLESFISYNKLPKGMSDVYYLLTPPGVTVCIDSAATHCSDYVRPARTPYAFEFEGRKLELEQEIFSFKSYKTERVSKQETETFTTTGYKNSLCSYHSDINPGGNPEGGPETIVYGVIPWVAGSAGERAIVSQKEIVWGYECQDGGFGVEGAAGAGKREHPKEETQAEQEAFEKGTLEEKTAMVEAKERETPHLQEPEQVGLGEDGMFDPALADVIINQLSVEQQDIVTDPLLNAWQERQGVQPHLEAADECRNYFLTGSMSGAATAQEDTNAGTLSNQSYGEVPYYLNTTFNLAADKIADYGTKCLSGIALQPNFTAPNVVKPGEVVGFDGMESDITLNAGTRYKEGTAEPTYAVYTWTIRAAGASNVLAADEGYAPGTPPCEPLWVNPCAASLYYTFADPGKYEVTLNVRDVGGNENHITHDVEVAGTGSSGGSGGGSGGQTNGSTSQSSSNGASGGIPAVTISPTPVARAAVISHSLDEALSKGLTVLYSVNEKVAGHFEVLISSKLAHKLGISGAPAADLPAGAEPQTVIAKALLVTLKGGRSAIHIKFSKRTAQRLRRLKKVSLELRLIVHNSGTHPSSTVVLTAVTLAKAAAAHRAK